MSLEKCPPSIILMIPNRIPKTILRLTKTIFFVIKYKIIIEKPTDASPDTNEQLVLQESLYSNQAVKNSFPLNSTISPGLDLPHKFFKTRFTNNTNVNICENKIK